MDTEDTLVVAFTVPQPGPSLMPCSPDLSCAPVSIISLWPTWWVTLETPCGQTPGGRCPLSLPPRWPEPGGSSVPRTPRSPPGLGRPDPLLGGQQPCLGPPLPAAVFSPKGRTVFLSASSMTAAGTCSQPAKCPGHAAHPDPVIRLIYEPRTCLPVCFGVVGGQDSQSRHS